MASYMILPGGIHLGFKAGHPVTVAKSDEVYSKVEAAVKAGASDEVIRDILDAKVKSVKKALCEGLEFKNEQVYHEGEFVGEVLSTRLLQMVEEGFTLGPFVKFLERLKQNPSCRVVDHLYAFLEHGKNPITEDGCFLAYKAVRADYFDIHSGTFNNAVGQSPNMRRNRVDENPDQTCSRGLHVCSFDYLPHFAHKNGHVMICKVDPADVVAIPKDYRNTKMRVCKYEVVGEHTGYYSDQREDVLAATAVHTSSADSVFVIECLDEDSGVFEEYEGFNKLSVAASMLEELVLSKKYAQVRLVNTETGAVILSQLVADYVPADPVIEDNNSNQPDLYENQDPCYEVMLVRGDNSRESLATGMDEDEALEHAVLGVSFDSDKNEYVEVVNEQTKEVIRTIR